MAAMHRQFQGSESVNLPVVNISESTAEIGRHMVDAAARYGFLYIDTRGTGFTPEIVERQFELVNPLKISFEQA